jgi:hypothetical protein
MKANMLSFLAALLLIGGGFAACNNSNDDDPLAEMFPDGISPVSSGGDLTAFFDENLKWIADSVFPYPADADPYETEMWYITDTCVMINSVEEFQAIDFRGKSFELPAIDFDAYTLVIGKWMKGGGVATILSQRLVVEPDQTTLNLLIGKKHNDSLGIIKVEAFWGLYPKITSESIQVNRVHKH